MWQFSAEVKEMLSKKYNGVYSQSELYKIILIDLLSSKLARKMEEEERERLEAAEKQEVADRELARKMWRETNSTPSTSKKRKNPVNWDEDFPEGQQEIERRLDQEKEDRELAQKLQSESQTPSSSSHIKSSKRQLSLMEFSSKVSDELSNCHLESPRVKQDEENNSTKDGDGDDGVVKNVFQILSESQKAKRNSAICKN